MATVKKMLKPVDKSKKPGLAKLPTEVRNKMGYQQAGGKTPKAEDGLRKGQYKRLGRIAEKNSDRAERVADRMKTRESRVERGKDIANPPIRVERFNADRMKVDQLQKMKEATKMKSGGKQMIKRADGSYSQRGLWDNIRAAKGSGKKPTAAMLKQEKKIKAKTKK